MDENSSQPWVMKRGSMGARCVLWAPVLPPSSALKTTSKSCSLEPSDAPAHVEDSRLSESSVK